MADTTSSESTESSPMGEIMGKAKDYGKSVLNHGMSLASNKVQDLTGKLTDFADGEGGPGGQAMKEGAKAAAEGKNPAKAAAGGALSGVKDKVKDAFTGGGGSGSSSQKLVNIVEWIDVGVPISVAYNQWTEFEQWSDFMKKVESVEHEEDEGSVTFKGQVFLSHRTWDATIKEMVPDDRIVWKSTGDKGHLDGAVTFHEVADRLTRICIVVEYYPQGFFEKTAQIWRAVGRRVQVEMKRYVRHVMTTTMLDPDSVEGWRGEIRDEEIVRTHEEVVEQEQQEAEDDESDEEYPEEEDAEADSADDEDAADEDEPEPEEDSDEADEQEPAEDEEYEEEPAASDEEEEYDEDVAPDEPAAQDEEEEYEEAPEAEEAEEPAEDEAYEEAPEAEEAEEPAEDEAYEEDPEAEEAEEPAEDEQSEEAEPEESVRK